MIDLDRETLAKMIDHTELSAHSGEKKIANLCSEARSFGFYTVCINGAYTSYAKEKLAGSGVLVCTVVGFPLGAGTTSAKAYEAREAVQNGAAEIDMVVNVGALRDKKLDLVRHPQRSGSQPTGAGQGYFRNLLSDRRRDRQRLQAGS
jgi:deoxyribose-phosphate aldolase